MTLSKIELLNNKFIDPGEGFTSRDARITIESHMIIKNRSIAILNNHLSIPFQRSNICKGLNCLLSNYNQNDRDNQLYFLKEYIEKNSSNYILMGDFNLSDQNYSYINFTNDLIDTGVCSGKFNYTWSNVFFIPFIRLDYILVKNEQDQVIIPISTKTFKLDKSDHLGIIAELIIL
ncbi:MAG: endonuclease/exonuclease/phosphatase family protein [Nanoarchaeota archaeon]